ncbi:nitrate- and nitrite sensing domain-containing protein [Streptomyces sp. NPDC088755]|uniref:sensor histidine kinase n=1 Tax=Streptomyces sp. NPDC088755 TaxID=3365888 RepID=UPI00380E30D3
MNINRRLVLLVTAPLTVALTFSLLALAPATDQALQAHRLTAMVEVAASAGEMTHQLQRERTTATALASGQGDADAFRESAEASDRSVAAFRGRLGRLSHVPAQAREALVRVEGFADRISTLRSYVRSGEANVSALAFGYRIVIADLNAYRDGIAQADGVDADIADRIRAAAALSQAAEYLAQQQVTVLRAQAAGSFTIASQRAFEATRLGYSKSTADLFRIGPGQWRTWMERTLSGPKALRARQLEDEIGRTATGENIRASPEEWQKATDGRLILLRSVEKRIDTSIVASVSDVRGTLIWTAVVEAVVVVLTLVGAVVVAVRLGRDMVRRLRGLRDVAHEVAHTGLPAMMDRISRPGALRGAPPEQVALLTGRPVKDTGTDEIGDVGEAFNVVHHEVVRLAAQQAHAHAQFAETLVSVARRGAQLTNVMVSELDTVQRDESDPERMQTLFALDHLAIRMERNTNSLLVLGGYGHGRVRSADVDCATVIMAAAQQIARFDRVSLGIVEPGVGITARAVHDVAHILAELLDNATQFSPPDKQVGVTVWRLWDRAVVQIVDEGVGIPAERRDAHNAALREPGSGIGDVRSMGLHVVARLAARHGITVELRDSSGPGTIAEVSLPAAVLAPVLPPPEASRADDERHGDGGYQGEPHPLAAPWQYENGQNDNALTGAVPAWPQGPDRVAGGHGMPAADGHRPHGDVSSDAREWAVGNVPAPHPVPGEPGPPGTAVSSSGLPMRQRHRSPQQRAHGPGTQQRSAAPAPKAPPRHRDSRQVSDVLAAYAQGINRSTRGRGRPATDDDTERNEK